MIRVKVTPTVNPDGGIKVSMEWTEIGEGEIPGLVGLTEEFEISRDKIGSGYFSRVEVEQCSERPGTFWVDAEGHRHFVLMAQCAELNVFGSDIG